MSTQVPQPSPSCPYLYKKGSPLHWMSGPGGLSSVYVPTALPLDSNIWCLGGDSWRLEHPCSSVASAAVQGQQVLTRLWQHDCGPGCQVSFGSCLFLEADPPAPAILIYLHEIFFHLRSSQSVSVSYSQEPWMIHLKIINLGVKMLGSGCNSAITCHLRKVFHPMGHTFLVSLTRDLH